MIGSSSTKEERITIADSERKYKKLKIVFDHPVIMNESKISFQIKTYLTKDAGVKITNGEITGAKFFRTHATAKSKVDSEPDFRIVSTVNRCTKISSGDGNINPGYCANRNHWRRIPYNERALRYKDPVIPYKEISSTLS